MRPLEEVVDEVEQARVGEVEVLEDQDDRGGRRQPLEERPPGPEELLRPDPGLDAEQGQQGRLDPAPLLRVRARASASVSATFARVVASSSVSSRPARPRTISPSAQKLIPSP